jgi:WD40 repeat protein/LysM repeat protein
MEFTMAKVFVSYSRKDITFAKRLTAELQKCEMDFWIDWEGIPPTVDWWREIEKGIEEADIFLFLISPDSAKSKVCGQEIETAAKNSKRIIPIVVRDIDWKDTPSHLGHLNYIFFRENDDFDAAVKKLITAIQTDYEWAATHRRLQVKALDWERNNKESGFLLRGLDLLDAEQDLAMNTSKEPHPTDLQREYVFSSRKAADKQKRITTGIAIGTVFALAALAAYGFYQAGVAKEQAQIALVRQLAAQSADLRDKNFELSLLLGIEANQEPTTLQPYEVLLENVQSHPELRAYLSGHLDDVVSVAFSPDGETLASGSRDRTIILWNLQTNRPIGQPLTGHSDVVTSIAFSPDGKTLASGSRDNTIILWDLETAKPVRQPLGEHGDGVTSIAFSPDGKTLASGSRDQKIILWDVETGERTAELVGHFDYILTVAFSPDGKTLASGSRDQKIILWDVETHQPISQPLAGHTDYVASVAFSPDGKILASGSRDKTIILWNVETHEPVGQPLKEHISDVASVAFSPNGKILASSSRDKTIILWNAEKHEPIGQPIKGHLNSIFSYVLSVAFSPDGKALASGGTDTNIILWDVLIDNPMSRLLKEPTGGITNLTFTPDSQTLASTSNSGLITFWDVAKGKSSGQTPIPNASGLKLSPDGKTLAYGNMDGTITLWDVAAGRTIGQALKGDATIITFNQDGKTVAFGTNDRKILLWDVAQARLIGQFPDEGADHIVLSPDGETLAVVSDTIIKLLNIKTGIFDHSLEGHTQIVTAIAFSPDSKTLVSGSNDTTIIRWDVSTGTAKGQPLEGHTQPVTSIAFRTDGIFASGSCGKQDVDYQCVEGEIHLWDLVSQQPIGLPFSGHTESITDLAFSPDGKTLASGSYDTIILWDLDPQSWIMKSCQQANRNFTRSEWGQYFPQDPYKKTCDDLPLEQPVTDTKLASPMTKPTPAADTVTQEIRPPTYTVHEGDSFQCIARRYNVNPKELLALNSVADDLIYGEELPYPGLVLVIPQTGNPYPGTRALRSHPTTYTVSSATETLNMIACLFGDVDPSAIAAVNGLSLGTELIPAQQLMIP